MPRVYVTSQQRVEANRDREISKLKKLIASNLCLTYVHSHMTQDEIANKYGTSAPTLRKVQRCENVRFPYDGFLSLLVDSGLTIVEVDK